MVDMVKIAAILRRTETDFDGEALNAIRAANRMLKAEKMNWADLLLKPAKPSHDLNERAAEKKEWVYPIEGEMDAKIAIIQARAYGKKLNAAISIYGAFQKYRRITQKQSDYFDAIYGGCL